MTATITGRKAKILFSSSSYGDSWKSGTAHAMSDFSLTFDRGTIEQELIAQEGNYFTQGAMSVEGSLTACRFGASGGSQFLDSIVDGSLFTLSGSVNADSSTSLHWIFHSAQVTGYDISLGDASTISEVSIDFTILNPYDVTYNSATGGITDVTS